MMAASAVSACRPNKLRLFFLSIPKSMSVKLFNPDMTMAK